MQTENESIQQKVNQTITEAQRAIAAGDQQTALLLLDQVLSQHPDHPDANYQSALVDLQIKGSEAALKKFEKAVTNKPQSETHWIGYIETLMETASLEIVLEALELGQQYALSSDRAQKLAAKYLSKNYDDPVSNLKDNTNQAQNDPIASSKQNGLENTLPQASSLNYKQLIEQQIQKANDLIEGVKKTEPSKFVHNVNHLNSNSDSLAKKIESLYEAALRAHENEDYIEATKGYLSVLSLDEKHPDANHNLGIIETHTKSAEIALPRFEAAVQANPKVEQYWVSYIDALIISGATDTASQAITYSRKLALSDEIAIELLQEIQKKTAQTHPALPYLNLLTGFESPNTENQTIYLHLGCGNRKFEGFINIDAEPGADMQLDLTQPLPWEQSTVDGIYSEHFFEHLSQAEGIALLHESRRVLKPGAVIRIAMPDLEYMVNNYVNNEINPEWDRFGLDWTDNRCERFNIAMRWWGHQWVYDQEELVRLGEKVGLQFKGRYQFGESDIEMFKNREHRSSSNLIVEFEKPNRKVSQDATPLVTIAIPAYNPVYLPRALDSALRQSYSNIEIVVGDDSEGDEIKVIVDAYQQKHPEIRYYKNQPEIVAGEPPDYGRTNYILCLNEAKGEFVKYLNDDDLLSEDCVAQMIECFKQYDDITLVTSQRQVIDQDDQPMQDMHATVSPFQETTLVEGLSFGNAMIKTGLNFAGEPTTAMFRKSDLIDNKPTMFSVDGKKYFSLLDVLMFQHLLTKGNVVYIAEKLSSFRSHSEQTQVMHRDEINQRDQTTWPAIKYSWNRLGFLK